MENNNISANLTLEPAAHSFGSHRYSFHTESVFVCASELPRQSQNVMGQHFEGTTLPLMVTYKMSFGHLISWNKAK